ncbi:MAG: ethanolamine ammonia-lyase subunit EutB, partial [Firmicutes bacterium]|nr:ethanolamine ammonia-lyase subunit EutB [Bacillota bacterium]
QNDSENLALLLAHAGMPAFVTAPMGDDIMLNYQLLGNHDWQTLLELSGLKRVPEFEKWLQKMEILDEYGMFTAKAGDASIFLK